MPVLQLPSSPKATFSINSQKDSPSLGTMEQGNKTNQISLLMFVKSSMVAIQYPIKAQPHSVRTSKSGICADLHDSVCLLLIVHWLLDILTTVPIYIASTNTDTHHHHHRHHYRHHSSPSIIMLQGRTVENTEDLKSVDLCSRPRSPSWHILSPWANHFIYIDLNFLL